MISGRELRRRTLTAPSGRSLVLRVVRPEPTVQNVALLRRTSNEWKAIYKALPKAERNRTTPHAYRTLFASDVAYIAARELTNPAYRVLVGEDALSGQVLGITAVVRSPQGWSYAFQTTRPQDQPGHPGGDQFRGIGAELTGATLQLMNEEACGDVVLHCLDHQACLHWRNVGFQGPDPNLRMTCSQAELAAQRYAHTPHEDPARGEEFSAGDPVWLGVVSSRPDFYGAVVGSRP